MTFFIYQSYVKENDFKWEKKLISMPYLQVYYILYPTGKKTHMYYLYNRKEFTKIFIFSRIIILGMTRNDLNILFWVERR